MTFSIIRTSSAYDSDLIFCNGREIGYIGKSDGSIGLTSCPRCHHENYAMSVSSGVCAWCEFDLAEATKETV